MKRLLIITPLNENWAELINDRLFLEITGEDVKLRVNKKSSVAIQNAKNRRANLNLSGPECFKWFDMKPSSLGCTIKPRTEDGRFTVSQTKGESVFVFTPIDENQNESPTEKLVIEATSKNDDKIMNLLVEGGISIRGTETCHIDLDRSGTGCLDWLIVKPSNCDGCKIEAAKEGGKFIISQSELE